MNKCDRLPEAVAFFNALTLRSSFGQPLVSNLELHHSNFNRLSRIFNNSANRPKNALNLYSHNSAKNTTLIRPETPKTENRV
jgi:hypothetical protein